MRKLYLYLLIALPSTLLYAQESQVWETGVFSCVAGVNGEMQAGEGEETDGISWQAIAGQPFDVTVEADTWLSGNVEVAASVREAEEIQSIQLDKSALALEEGKGGTLTVTLDAGETANETLIWHSSDESVATVNEAGVVIAHQAGKAMITVTTASGNFFAECEVTITKPAPEPEPEPTPVYVTGVELNLTSATLEVGESLRLVATVRPAYADDPSVRWSSSDAAIASVDERGLVQALRPGSATIAVTTNDGGFTATCALTVNEIPTAIEDVEAKPVVYPTIVRDKFHVNVSKPQAVYLIDINGRVLRVIQARAGETTVWMNGVGTGVYLVRLDGRTVRIIKE